MGWNISAEVIAFIIVLIISVYSRKSHAVPSYKNRVFQLCLVTTLGAIGTNLASTLMISYAPKEILGLTWLVTMLYFVLTPLLGTAYYYYATAVISEARPVGRRFLILSSLPCILYAGCVIANAATGCLFSFDEAGNYQQGPFISTTYVVFYLYCVGCFFLVSMTRAPIDPEIKRILVMFPLIAVAVIAVQQAFPTYLLSGSAAACSLLIIYLYLQNKRLSVDSLTGLPNRQELLSMTALMHEKQRAFAAVIVSLSNFKFINDKFGHERGDLVLREFSRYLESQAKGMHLYRYSGDQFAFLIDEEDIDRSLTRGATRTDPVNMLLHALRERMKEAWDISGNPYTMSAAIGVVSYPDIAREPGEVIAALEYTATRSKTMEPNTPCICTPSMINDIRRRSEVADVVRKAIKNKSFAVHFQPVWSESLGYFITAEALCRLTDDELGPISPVEFIPIAEQSGLISEVTDIVLDQACAFISDFRAAHPDSKFRGVSVNFSAVQFMQQDLDARVLAIVEKHGIPLSCLRIELTESALIANPDAVQAFMETMRAHDVRFYLDDFGTGYSNLSSMLNLPFDVIKIDKSILWSASNGEGAFKLLCELVAGFAAVGRLVLAEGVETEEQRAQLDRAKCDLRQGYLFARPLPAEEAAKVIVENEPAR